MKQVFTGVYAAATLGILLREFTFGHVSQLAAVLRRHLLALAERSKVLDGIQTQAFVDIDSLLRPVYGHAKQGASFGHTKIAGKSVLRRRWSGASGCARGGLDPPRVQPAWSPTPSPPPSPRARYGSWSAVTAPT